MNIKKINQFLVLLAVSLILSGCVVKDGKIVMKNKKEPFKHNTPLIKVDMKTKGKSEIQKTVELGPKPVEDNSKRKQKRKKISSEIQKNYLSIPDENFSKEQSNLAGGSRCRCRCTATTLDL